MRRVTAHLHRLLRAHEQIRECYDEPLTIHALAKTVGLSSLGSFSTMFKRRTGASPAAWQRRARGWVPVDAA